MPEKDFENNSAEKADMEKQPAVENEKEGLSARSEDGLRQERDEYLDGWKRAKAELINYKNEELKRMNEIIRFAGEDIVRDMVGVMDSFDLCIGSLSNENQSLAKGIYMIRAQMEDMLKRRGLERIIVSVGHEFDPALHEAVSVIESDKPPGVVVEEIEKGYTWNGKLIRPARVVVSK